MVDEEIVVTKLRHINEYTNDLREMQGLPKKEYKSDVIIQRAVERTCMNLVQACIDIAKHIRAAEDLSQSGTSKQNIEALGNAGIISRETQKRLAEAVGFRNILAHRYGDVDHDIVYDVLHNDLRWFEQYQQELAQWFQQQ
ncbi:type VII toxin-antitoxin system HepT family RNase toxin [Halocatena pleomorpha]|uniref:DUF86 domain-containing protein n=1 Tax=Halocatena pleomorpha TaxID=1785090 RepID=A0A3P3RJT6_9EURY|nr:DUF86 domain-containing protein [Halocatena pleomorpha]RRJ33100.1 DUF86 domain-containing protein [Halocatena pleomorpha]